MALASLTLEYHMKITTLAKRALRTTNLGALFETGSGTRGILLDSNVNARVVITETTIRENPESYLGKRIIANNTEVKEIK